MKRSEDEKLQPIDEWQQKRPAFPILGQKTGILPLFSAHSAIKNPPKPINGLQHRLMVKAASCQIIDEW
jgi:hypothetical protein